MVTGFRMHPAGAGMQIGLVTLAAVLALAWQSTRVSGFPDLWLTKDQQGRLAFEAKDWESAFELFQDPAWKGTAAYRGGKYEASAEAFVRAGDAAGFFNRGDSLMKKGDYRGAIESFELALAERPDWTQAQENLELARYTLEYIERSREQSDTGEQTELGADDFEFDNEGDRGKEIEITRESTIEAASAEKWMRAVDTDTADFLRTRFAIELVREDGL